jgi:hypothetical protein
MPAGSDRIAALKKAGQMRFEAYKRKRVVLDLALRLSSRRLDIERLGVPF